MSILITIAATTAPVTSIRGAVAQSDDDSGADLITLLERARAGDREACAQALARHADLVNGVLLAHTPLADLEDARQEVYFKAWRRLSSLRDDHAFGPWLATIARNTGVSFARSRWRRLRRTAMAAAGRASAHIDSGAGEILEEIRALPEAYRETLALRLVEQMSAAEIARRTGLTEGSVRVNLHRGMKLLRERLEPQS